MDNVDIIRHNMPMGSIISLYLWSLPRERTHGSAYTYLVRVREARQHDAAYDALWGEEDGAWQNPNSTGSRGTSRVSTRNGATARRKHNG